MLFLRSGYNYFLVWKQCPSVMCVASLASPAGQGPGSSPLQGGALAKWCGTICFRMLVASEKKVVMEGYALSVGASDHRPHDAILFQGGRNVGSHWNLCTELLKVPLVAEGCRWGSQVLWSRIREVLGTSHWACIFHWQVRAVHTGI